MSNKNISHIIADTIVEFDKDFAYEDAFELAIQIGNKIKIDVDTKVKLYLNEDEELPNIDPPYFCKECDDAV